VAELRNALSNHDPNRASPAESATPRRCCVGQTPSYRATHELGAAGREPGGWRLRQAGQPSGVHKGGLVKGGLASYVFPLCNFNTLCSVSICKVAKPPLLTPLCELPKLAARPRSASGAEPRRRPPPSPRPARGGARGRGEDKRPRRSRSASTRICCSLVCV